jgi:hypothetical protein
MPWIDHLDLLIGQFFFISGKKAEKQELPFKN